MSFLPKALPALATGVSAAGAYVGGQQDEKLLRMQAVVAREQGLADEQAKRRENRAYRGEQAATLAENGLSSTGSSAEKAAQDATLAELDALNIRYQGEMRAQGLINRARAAGSQGTMLAGARLLTGASDDWARRRQGAY